MSTIVLEESVRIPAWVVDLDSFRRWRRSDKSPERGRFSFFHGEIWVDMSPEELFKHNKVKAECCSVITVFLKTERRGWFFHDRTLLSNARAGLSTEPDGVFVSWDSFKKRRVRLVKGTEGYVELVGTPDMVLEVVSPTSVRKDNILLRHRYWLARVPEYWIVDARGERVQFDILRYRRSGYFAAPKRAAWQASAVFGKSFKLTQATDELGFPEYTLAVR